MNKSLFLALLTFLLAGSPGAVQDPKLWAVIPTQCEGGQVGYRLQQAIDLAKEGDAILMSGHAQQVTISGKSLTLTSETNASIDRLTIRNITAGQKVVIEGITIENEVVLSAEGFIPKPALFINTCEGTILIERCEFDGGTLIGPTTVLPARGVFVKDSPDVTFNRCKVKGGKVFDGISRDVLGGNAAAGIHSQNSQVYLHECVVIGGQNDKAPSALTSVPEIIGGPGIKAVGGFVFLNGGEVRGGQALYQNNCGPDNPLGPGCMDYGTGGTAIEGSDDSLIWLRDTNLIGGLGGDPFGDGDGPFLDSTGIVVPLDGSTPEIVLDGPLSIGDPIELLLLGEEGDMVEVRAADSSMSMMAPDTSGVLHLDTPFYTESFGPLPSSGELSVTLDFEGLTPGFQFQGTYLQAEFFNGVQARLSNASHFTVIDEVVIDQNGLVLEGNSLTYPTTQYAIDCAKDGDAILVSTTQDLIVKGKSITLLPENEETLVTSLIIQNVPLGGKVVVRGLNFALQDTPDPNDNLVPLIILNCEGSVLIEDCQIIGNTSLASFPSGLNSTQAVRIINSADATFVRCFLRGGSTPFPFGSKFAVRAALSNASFYDCKIVGGINGSAVGSTPKGRNAMRIRTGFLSLSGCQLQSFPAELLTSGPVTVWKQDTMPFKIKKDGASTQTIVDIPGTQRQLEVVDSPIMVGEASTLKVTGEPMDLVFVNMTSDLGHLPIMSENGVMHTSGTPMTLALGLLPASGELEVPIMYDQLDGFVGHTATIMQAMHIDLASDIYLSSPTVEFVMIPTATNGIIP